MGAALDTRKVATRRKLRFQTLDDAWAEVQRLAAAEREGRLERMGNWTLGQILGHLSAWIGYAYTPAPLPPPPWFVRMILKLQRRRIIHGEMPAGMRIRRVDGGTLATDPVPLDESLEQFHVAIERLRNNPPTAPSPAFGQLTHDEAIQLNLRHAELHLGFLRERS